MALMMFMTLVWSIFCLQLSLTIAHPIMIKLTKSKEKCFSFSVEKNDNARLALMAISEKDTDETIEYYSDMLKNLDYSATEAPDAPFETQKNFRNLNMRSGVFARLKRLPRPIMRHQPLRFHSPIIFPNIANMGRTQESDFTEYEICFNPSTNNEEVRLMFVLTFKNEYNDEKFIREQQSQADKEPRKLVKKHQFTPLERVLQSSTIKANRVVAQMKYMENREARMRQTSESTNSRVRYFNYMSILVMILTTFFQMFYLKIFFKKKKVL